RSYPQATNGKLVSTVESTAPFPEQRRQHTILLPAFRVGPICTAERPRQPLLRRLIRMRFRSSLMYRRGMRTALEMANGLPTHTRERIIFHPETTLASLLKPLISPKISMR